jgi:hypothetical protein
LQFEELIDDVSMATLRYTDIDARALELLLNCSSKVRLAQICLHAKMGCGRDLTHFFSLIEREREEGRETEN